MSAAARLPVVLMWHMHQPQYRDAFTGQYALPWTYLHAIKDYADMAAHLEAAPAARAVVNFTPLLLEQLDGHCRAASRNTCSTARRCRIRSSDCSVLRPCRRARRDSTLLRACLRAQQHTMIERFGALP